MRCCSLLISPQTQMSFGSPHVGQISAMILEGYSIGTNYLRITVFVCVHRARRPSIWNQICLFVCANAGLFIFCSLLQPRGEENVENVQT